MGSVYVVTVEFVPDTAADPDLYRLHRETTYRVPATRRVVEYIRHVEEQLRAEEERMKEVDDDA